MVEGVLLSPPLHVGLLFVSLDMLEGSGSSSSYVVGLGVCFGSFAQRKWLVGGDGGGVMSRGFKEEKALRQL